MIGDKPTPGGGEMKLRRIPSSETAALWELHRAYKAEIGEEEPSDEDRERLERAIEEERILFFGAWDVDELVGCCSVTVGFSTFDYEKSGVFEDFYILPGYRHKGLARELVGAAFRGSGVSTLTVGCADCDADMYRAIGFSVRLGALLAME